MPGVARVGISLQQRHGRVIVHSVVDDAPAAMSVAKGDVLVAVNGEPVGADAQAAQRMIVHKTKQCTETGRVLPVRLTIGTLVLPSPKGVDELDMLSLDISDPAAQNDAAANGSASPKKHAHAVVQSL